MDHIKIHKIISPTSFTGLRGTENQIKLCTTVLQAKPYDFTQASPKTIKMEQQVVCCSTLGWARAEVKNRHRNQMFQVQLMDYLEDIEGTPMIENIGWESIRILPRNFTTDKIPKLAGVFYLVDESEEKQKCGHVVDVKRTSLLLERMLETEDLFRCRILKPLDPLHAVIELHIDLPLNGFLNGQFLIPYIEPNKKEHADLIKESPWLKQEFDLLKEEIIKETKSANRKLLMDKFEKLILGSEGPGLEDLDPCSDDEVNGADFQEPAVMKQTDFVVAPQIGRPLSGADATQEFCISPYRKEKGLAEEYTSPSRKKQQALKKKQRNKAINQFNGSGDSYATNRSDSSTGDQLPSARSDSSNAGTIPIEFLQTEYFHCGDCGLSASTGHKCPRKGLGNRKLEDMWGRNK